MDLRYKAPETTSGDLDTPTTLWREGSGGFLPGDSSEPEKKYFCMAELYDASVKDYESVNTINAEYVVTILIPHPYTDYIPKQKDQFTVEDYMYTDVKFNVQKVAPKNEWLLKIVGVAYSNQT